MEHNQAVSALNDVTTSSETLAVIAQENPDLRPYVLAHPNIYQGLAEWISAVGAVTPQSHAQPLAQPKKKNNLLALILGIVLVVALLGGGAFFAVTYFAGGKQGSELLSTSDASELQQLLEHTPLPQEPGEMLSVQFKNVNQILVSASNEQDPFPAGDSMELMESWFERQSEKAEEDDDWEMLAMLGNQFSPVTALIFTSKFSAELPNLMVLKPQLNSGFMDENFERVADRIWRTGDVNIWQIGDYFYIMDSYRDDDLYRSIYRELSDNYEKDVDSFEVEKIYLPEALKNTLAQNHEIKTAAEGLLSYGPHAQVYILDGQLGQDSAMNYGPWSGDFAVAAGNTRAFMVGLSRSSREQGFLGFALSVLNAESATKITEGILENKEEIEASLSSAIGNYSVALNVHSIDRIIFISYSLEEGLFEAIGIEDLFDGDFNMDALFPLTGLR